MGDSEWINISVWERNIFKPHPVEPGKNRCRQKSFFSHLSNEKRKKKTYPQFETVNSQIDYCQYLLKYATEETSFCGVIQFLCEDDVMVTIPLILVIIAWESLMNMIKDCNCDLTDIIIHIPCTSNRFLKFKEALTVGISYLPVEDIEDMKRILDYLPLANLIISESCIENENRDEEIFIGDEWCDDVENEYKEKSSSNEGGSVNKFWSRKVSGYCEPVKHCSIFCKNDCVAFVKSRSTTQLETIKEMFNHKNISEVKSKLLNHLIVQKAVGRQCNNYIIDGHEFCTSYLNHITGISEYLLKKVLKDFWKGVKHYEHGSTGIVKNLSVATVHFISWFRIFLSLHGQNAPDDEVVVLSYWLKGKALYDIYVDEAQSPHISLSTFYQHMKTYFGPNRIDRSLPCVRISKYSSHSVCDVCDLLNENQLLCKTETELDMIRALRNQHKLDFGLARQTIEYLRQSAIDFPEDTLFCQIDGMDNSKR